MVSSEEDSFFLFLPSDCNVKGIFIEENTRSNYKIPLPDPIDLGNESWEVGLSEIFVPNYIHNIFPPFNIFKVGWKTMYNELVEYDIRIPSGTYDAKHLASAMNEGISVLNAKLWKKKKLTEARAARASQPKRLRKELSLEEEGSSESEETQPNVEAPGEYFSFHGKIRYDEVTKRFGFLMRQREFFAFDDLRLRSIMGFEHTPKDVSAVVTPPPIPKKPQWMNLEHPAYLNQFNQYLYVYCDLVSYSVVGNSMAPILRVVDVMQNSYGGENGTKEILHQSYEIPHYYKVGRNQLKVINIQLCDSLGEKAQINAGIVICLLHFRKVPK